MNIKQLISDEEAVSPVIGVILMVAITVILAAVIASFVLGLGDQAQQTTPTASIDFDYTESYDSSTYGSVSEDGVLTITHDGGDSVLADELYLRGSGIAGTGPGGSYDIGLDDSWADAGTHSSGDDITAGKYVEADASEDYTARIVYQSQEGDTSATLGQNEGPAA